MAISLTKGKDLPKNEISNGTIKYIFTHPEDIINNRKITDFFQQAHAKSLKTHLIIDEAHCILELGADFRPDFRRLCQLRAVFSCRVLALSATVTSVGQKVIMKNLLMENCKTVIACPTKDNIELIVLKRPSATAKGNSSTTPYDFIFEPVLKELKHMGNGFPITVIYCKSIQLIGYGYEMARQILEDRFYAGEKTPENARVVMFHSSMEDSSGKLKSMILEELQNPPDICSLRLIFASVALGMGVDLKHIQRVIHAGPPTTLETYVQEIGRSGRAENQAQAILYFTNNDLAVTHMHTNMKEYCKSDECKRLLVNQYFSLNNTSKPTICCNVCQPDIGLQWKFSQLST